MAKGQAAASLRLRHSQRRPALGAAGSRWACLISCSRLWPPISTLNGSPSMQLSSALRLRPPERGVKGEALKPRLLASRGGFHQAACLRRHDRPAGPLSDRGQQNDMAPLTISAPAWPRERSSLIAPIMPTMATHRHSTSQTRKRSSWLSQNRQHHAVAQMIKSSLQPSISRQLLWRFHFILF